MHILTSMYSWNWLDSLYTSTNGLVLRYYECVRSAGDLIQPVGLDQYPSGEQLATAYNRKTIGIIKLVVPADVPGFYEARSIGENAEDTPGEDGVESWGRDLEDAECHVCEQRFLSSAMLKSHQSVCKVGLLSLQLKVFLLGLMLMKLVHQGPFSAELANPVSHGRTHSLTNSESARPAAKRMKKTKKTKTRKGKARATTSDEEGWNASNESDPESEASDNTRKVSRPLTRSRAARATSPLPATAEDTTDPSSTSYPLGELRVQCN